MANSGSSPWSGRRRQARFPDVTRRGGWSSPTRPAVSGALDIRRHRDTRTCQRSRSWSDTVESATAGVGPRPAGLADPAGRRGRETVGGGPTAAAFAGTPDLATFIHDRHQIGSLRFPVLIHPTYQLKTSSLPARARGGGAARSGPGVRGGQGRSDALRPRLSKLRLRHGIRYEDGHAWTEHHCQWLATVRLEHAPAQTMLLDARGAIDALAVRRDGLQREIIRAPAREHRPGGAHRPPAGPVYACRCAAWITGSAAGIVSGT